MSDLIFIAATIVFYAICALYVRWCDTIVGPDDFSSARDHGPSEPQRQLTVTASCTPATWPPWTRTAT